MRRLPLYLVATLSTASVSAQPVTEYSGRAFSNGEHFYTENHQLTYDKDGVLVASRTTYLDPEGAPIAELASDYRDSLPSPSHVFEDFRTGEINGVRREGGQVILFLRERGKIEKTKNVSKSSHHEPLTVGCQGLNYYLLENSDLFEKSNPLKVQFLIPGKLDAYDFEIERVSEPTSETLEFEITIHNWFLRLFAPKLKVKYDRATKKIVSYSGISAIKDNSGRTRLITIDYSQPTKRSL